MMIVKLFETGVAHPLGSGSCAPFSAWSTVRQAQGLPSLFHIGAGVAPAFG